MTRLVFKVLIFLLSFSKVYGLECYACDEQPENTDKCIKTVIQCEEHEDVCYNAISWKLNENWTPESEYIYAIYKGCDTLATCEQRKHALVNDCKRDYFNDWSCRECCHGDRCNYYVTMGSSAQNPRMFVLITTVLASVLHLFNV